MTTGSQTIANKACSVTWKNNFYIIGGAFGDKGIMMLTGYNLNRVGSLAFEHTWGSCNNIKDEKLFLSGVFDFE